MIPDCPPEQVDRLIQQYRSIYLGRGHKNTRVCSGASREEDLAKFSPDYWIDDLRELCR